MPFSALLALCAGNSTVTGEFPTQRPVTQSFDVFFDLRLNKRLSNQSWCGWFETPLRSLWRHCNVQRNLVWAVHRTPKEDRLLKLALQWRYNERDGLSNHQPIHCLLNRLFKCRSKKRKLRVTGLCEGNSPVTGEFPAQMASNAEYVSIWWRHHGLCWLSYFCWSGTGAWRGTMQPQNINVTYFCQSETYMSVSNWDHIFCYSNAVLC